MKKFRFIILTVLVFGCGAGFAFADGATTESNAGAIDMVWTLIAAFLVFFMQAGFAMVETGFTRAKNAGNILMKNLMDFAVGAIAFFVIGYGVMFGASKLGLFGTDGFLLLGADAKTYSFWMFQVVFAATAATIVSGAMAERTKFKSYLVYSAFISAFIYPVVGHWIWGGGWLGAKGFLDFAGSTVVHSVGGWAALAGAIILGPRTGKYITINGKTEVKAIPGHNIPLAALGVFILWFGWYGFNAGSTTAGTNESIAVISLTTTLAAAAGAIAAMFFTWFRFGKPDPSMSLNGALAGLVGITAGCAYVSPLAALVIGLCAGVLVALSVEFIDKVLKIDDPVGAISVHGVCGTFGTLAVGLFATDGGLFTTGNAALLGIQALGVVTVFAWVFGTASLLFLGIRLVMGLRVSKEEELKGLDIEEHGIESYSGFQIFLNQ